MTKKSRDRRKARRKETFYEMFMKNHPKYEEFNALSIGEIKSRYARYLSGMEILNISQ